MRTARNALTSTVASMVVALLPVTPALVGPAAASDESLSPPSGTTLYVRADLGVASYDASSFSQADLLDRGGSFIEESFDQSVFVGAGLGWRLSQHLRLDLTGEYRVGADVRAVDHVEEVLSSPDGLITASTVYEGEHTAFVGLANLYVDLVKWQGFTPYIGGGIGVAHNRLKDFTTLSNGSFEDFATGDIRRETTTGEAGNGGKTSFAWALMAGTSYDLSADTKLDLGYRYLHLGNDVAATTSLIECHCGTVGEPLKVSGLDSHEFRIGIRWEFNAP